jgi:hypothetical protein
LLDAGIEDVSIVSTLVASSNGNGFQFDYAFGTVPNTATPLPATLPLFAAGLGALGLLGWRRKRKNATAIVAA